MNQIVIAIKEENILTYLTSFDNRPANPLLPLAKRDCVTKNFETQVIPRTHTIPKKKLAPSVTIKAKHLNINQTP